ncbi:MAG: ATP-grasp domain-containing protein [Bacteroidota bacterium]
MKKNILVFPCGSEIALEVYRSLKYSKHFNVFGASSVDDHGRFVFENYIGDLPFIQEASFISILKDNIRRYNIDIIYPSMDSVIVKLKMFEKELGCIVICSPLETTQICLSKLLTYVTFKDVVRVPVVYSINTIKKYPVFVKPIIGYGSRGAKKINTYDELNIYMSDAPDSIITEFLSGKEYTLDCFTDRKGNLKYFGARERRRISNGISVNTVPIKDFQGKFYEILKEINKKLVFRGAWFIQLKENSLGDFVLMEIASRLGGSSCLYRNKGINFAQLSIFDALGYDVEILENDYTIELDRALNSVYKIPIKYEEVFLDFDDCLIIEKFFFNTDIIKFIFQCFNQEINVTILSRNDGDLSLRLRELNIYNLFSRVIQIPKNAKKSDYIDNPNSIFIDDSFAERKDVYLNLHIPVFSPDMVESLIA